MSCHTIEIATIALLPTIITSHPLILIQPADNNSMVNAEVQDHIENEPKDEGAMQDEEEEDEQEQEPDLDKADRAFLMTFKMGPSKTKQIGHMLTHLKIFLATLSPSVTLLSFSIKHINDKFVTAWADYLGKDALRQDESKQPIKVQTALNYLSAFKQLSSSSYFVWSVGTTSLPIVWMTRCMAVTMHQSGPLRELRIEVLLW